MNAALGGSTLMFASGGVISLATSWLLVTRLERMGERLGFSEGLLGVVAALAADAPEITASVTAMAHRQQVVGAGVVIGSNVFNLAALLGVGAVVAGGIGLHRRVVLLGGAVSVYVALVCLAAVTGVVNPAVALGLVLAGLIPYVVALGAHGSVRHVGLPDRWAEWLASAIVEEEDELELAISPRRGTGRDAIVGLAALVVVIGASVAMEHGATSLGAHFGVPQVVVGGLVLAIVTSLPNAVAAVYLARRGRGAAAWSTALNSNAINVAAGLLVPAAVLGMAKPSASAVLIAGWYLGLTVVALALAYAGRGLGRTAGWLLVGAYILCVAILLALT